MQWMDMRKALAGLCGVVLAACGGGGGDGGGVTDSKRYDNQPQLTLPAATVLCESQGMTPKIVNGTACVAPEASPVVLLVIQEPSGATSACSGVLVTPTAVVTAAHCVEGKISRIVAAQWKGDGTADPIDASSWVPHPGYSYTDGRLLNDLGVVHLRSPLSNPTMPVLTSQRLSTGQSAYISGWGRPSYELSVGLVRVDYVEDSRAGFVFDEKLSNTCMGDSGGPMYRVINGRAGVVGVTSGGTSANCAVGEWSVFTNLQAGSMIDFLRGQIPGLPEM